MIYHINSLRQRGIFQTATNKTKGLIKESPKNLACTAIACTAVALCWVRAQAECSKKREKEAPIDTINNIKNNKITKKITHHYHTNNSRIIPPMGIDTGMVSNSGLFIYALRITTSIRDYALPYSSPSTGIYKTCILPEMVQAPTVTKAVPQRPPQVFFVKKQSVNHCCYYHTAAVSLFLILLLYYDINIISCSGSNDITQML